MKSGILSVDAQNYNLMKKSLDASSTRSEIIENNISNANIANYKRRYVTFEETLKETSDSLNLRTTKEKHIDTESKFGEIKVVKDNSSSMRQDGNNVNIEIEKVNQAANTLMYYSLISQINNRLSTKRYVINGR
ncbi:flagellar basal-body rod protein FlgB [Clostridium tetanomorphum]|uniref:Flagellar basal body rod protein FlgB n=1 Tax=Clostridium tetanomorphum TaxID=1553 RepID=A0A923E929_CLOTT|nr:flagellar basal body rod protein FlgB [Clostridium tetanomorphum]KAJ49906.1 flagellar basal body rod protein FlgB [Clostridium tetanomorphum DSM 665]MBC2396689.1 flagellar basal body rod protein FlgB [Clostridium tetanomorphum]MBP1866156.1 flagellar basal-body rod protein FlgB [Clostridium tetanomorphum]NRS85135.1 flagellar basal-body rod protein FlgB [Clostridium tetanomorphum]NRZ98316.1 flagellar basal-body rod protein FlgB [Clostridium tetanomorphum]